MLLPFGGHADDFRPTLGYRINVAPRVFIWKQKLAINHLDFPILFMYSMILFETLRLLDALKDRSAKF